MKTQKLIRKIRNGEVYEDTYTLRVVGGGISTSIPKKVVERKARELGISVEEFIRDYEVQILYDDFKEIDGVFRFVKKEER